MRAHVDLPGNKKANIQAWFSLGPAAILHICQLEGDVVYKGFAPGTGKKIDLFNSCFVKAFLQARLEFYFMQITQQAVQQCMSPSRTINAEPQ